MKAIRRREFLGAAAAGLLNEKIGQISPDIYGHFVERLGGVVYDDIMLTTTLKTRGH
jgi:alpha-L-arabinofuranosidase